jgi:hypothetical protein
VPSKQGCQLLDHLRPVIEKKNGQKQDYRNILTAFAVKKYSAMMLNNENQDFSKK